MAKAEWHKIADKMLDEGIDYQAIADACGVKWQSVNQYAYLRRKKQRQSTTKVQTKTPENIHELVLKLVRKERSIENICDQVGISERVLKATIEDLRDEGYVIEEIDGSYALIKKPAASYNRYKEDWNGDKIIRFGSVADSHLGNRWQQLTFLHHLYDIFQKEGIKTVYHAGDITDGFYKNRPGHIYELIPGLVGADQQAEYVVKNYPKRDSIETKFISGNHDDTHIQNGGVEIGKMIAKDRPDMVYLGIRNAKIELTPQCVLELNHPIDGAAYALSYSIQKYIDSMSGGEKPNILINGHHHKAMSIFYRNVHGIEAGCTQAQTPWMKGKRLAAHMGGWIIELRVNDDGTINRIIPEFIPLYKPIENDY